MIAQPQVRPDDDASRHARRRQWFERVDREIDVATRWEASISPDLLVGHLDGMADIAAESDVLAPTDLFAFRERIRLVKLRAYQKHIDVLLEQAMAATRDKTRQQERGELFRQMNEALNMAARLGIDATIKQGILDRLEITAKADADRDAARFDPVQHRREHRTFSRWRQPPLVVAINGRSFNTVDWSLGGALLAEVEDFAWKCGQSIEVGIGLSAGKLHADKMVVVRYSPEQKRLAIRSRRFASVLMQVKRECETAGMEPI